METLNFSKIQNKELQTYSTRVKGIINIAQISPEALDDLQFLKIPFDQKVDAFEAAGLTGDIEYTGTGKKELDIERDSAFLGLRGMVSSFKFSTNQAQVELAARLESIIRKHGWYLNNLSYAKQSAGTRNLLNDIATKFTLEELQSIYADAWVNALRASQEAYEAYALKLNEGKANQGISQTELKRDLVLACTDIVAYLPFLNRKIADPKLEVLIDDINKLIIDTNAIIKSRETKASQMPTEAN
ncbi:DUF6261 family protein [Saccharicrinis aurantiacus]|uniref:DUF6261 family protein n=1 Tax=Saccharicrinis aurantiacus TaxID=1849719 RepID=UPI002493017D|nr:DUF6261 family protein [Saccharicrinis aurantiacus]